MRLLLATLVFSAPLFAQTCDFTVQPASLSVPSTTSTGQVSVLTQSGCAWTVSNTDPNLSWLKFDTIQGTGSGSAPFKAEANPTALVRTGTFTIAGKTISVTQAAAVCSYSINPKSQNFPVQGGLGSFGVTTGCVWNVSSNNPDFIGVTQRNNTIGPDTVSFNVVRNPCVYGRTGSISVNTTSSSALSPIFGITQDGSPANLTVSSANITAGSDSADGRITVSTGQGCAWSATSSESWLRIISGAGAGNGAITYNLLANSTATRVGTIHIGSLTATVTQTASGPPLPSVAAVTSSANYRSDAVSPGEIVTIFGDNMGPATLVPLQVTGGYVTNLLAGTQVLFDGTPAALIYTKNTQVSAVVPYGVAGRSTTKVAVIYNGLTSSAMTMAVQAAHPGIFTLDSSGLGPGAILNQDYTVNSGPNGAARGSVVAIYCTGGGVTNPASDDGGVTSSVLPYLAQNVTVQIGGIDAQVQYAGGAPLAVAGVTQINAVVPAGVTPGSAVPVVVKVGNVASSAGVTLSVR